MPLLLLTCNATQPLEPVVQERLEVIGPKSARERREGQPVSGTSPSIPSGTLSLGEGEVQMGQSLYFLTTSGEGVSVPSHYCLLLLEKRTELEDHALFFWCLCLRAQPVPWTRVHGQTVASVPQYRIGASNTSPRNFIVNYFVTLKKFN